MKNYNPATIGHQNEQFGLVEDAIMIDEQFSRDMEASIARSLEEGSIEISENDIHPPFPVANDGSLPITEMPELSVLGASIMSNAA